jgi:hypothetical protein
MSQAWTWIFIGLAMFGSGVMRGFSGFGAALFAVPAMSMAFPPAFVAPVVMGLQVLAGAQTLRGDWAQILWRCGLPLAISSVAATFIGARLLVDTDPHAVRLAIGLIVLATVGLLLTGWRFARMPGSAPTVLVGACSGLLNGFSAMGGPPLVVYFLSGPFAIAASRATMNLIFTVQSTGSMISIAALGGLTRDILVATALAYPAQAAGIAVGHRLFLKVGNAYYRRVCILALGILSVLLIIRSVWSMLA